MRSQEQLTQAVKDVALRQGAALVGVANVDPGAIFIDTPARSDAWLCMTRTEGKDHWPVRGECIRACPLPLGRKRHITRRLKALRSGQEPGPL